MSPASILTTLFFSFIALLAFVAVLVKAGASNAWHLLTLPIQRGLRRHASARA